VEKLLRRRFERPGARRAKVDRRVESKAINDDLNTKTK
jgi:hypothetical protein